MPLWLNGKTMQNLKSISTGELENLIEEYPWFAAARSEYLSRSRDTMTEEELRLAVARAGLFLISKGDFLKVVSGRVEKERETARALAARQEEQSQNRRYFVVGGDYFGKEDFKELENRGLAVETPNFSPVGSVLDSISDFVAAEPEKKSSEEDLCTETLAQVFVDQQFYSRAIEIYEKLILLYPEKSAYFASLIEKVKNINI